MRSRYFVLLLVLALIVSVSGLTAGTLTVTKDGGGDGYIKVNGVDQTLPFSQSYAAGTILTLEAIPTDSKSQFEWWSGYVNSSDNPVTFSMPWLGTPSIVASFQLSPPWISVNNIPWYGVQVQAFVGFSTYWEFEIGNLGGQTLYVTSMSITGPNASEFFIQNVLDAFSVPPGPDRHTVAVRFHPISSGKKVATLNIFNNDPDDYQFQIELEGWGIDPPDIALNPTSWDFGQVSIGDHSDKSFSVRNDGLGILAVNPVVLTGPSASEFTILDVINKVALEPGTSQNVTVRFAPTSTGAKNAFLSITSNDPDENPFQVGLSGTGKAASAGTPDIASSPASWDFGAVNTGSHQDKTFIISNAGAANLNVTAVTLSGSDASEFHIQSGGGSFTLVPAATRNVVVRFSPTGSGLKSASLSFTSNDPDENPFLVSLSGGGEFFIVIDANMDNFYSTLTGPENGFLNIPSPLYNLNGAPVDDRDLSAKVWMAWDNTYLYLYEEVKDDTVHLNNVTDWANDCIELKIDPDPSKQATEGVITFNLTALDSADTQPAYYSGIANLADPSDYARRRTADGYILELRVKWTDMTISGRGPVVPAVGNVFGLAINQHDNDRSGRQASVQWSAKLADEVWFNPRLLGRVTFQANHKLKMEARNAIVDTLVNPLAALYIPGGLPWPMLTMDVGSVQAAGSASYDDGTGAYTVSGSGVDIWENADGFRYVFRQISGDVEVTARITDLTRSDPWSKGGLMIRDGLTAGSKNAMVVAASDHGLTFQNRSAENGASVFTQGSTSVVPPYWLRIVRYGNTFIGSASANGVSWVEVGRKVIAMNDPVYVGMAVTAHHNGLVSTGTFSNVTFKFTGITGVEGIAVSNAVLKMFALSPNYPNPFNSFTRFTYDIPHQAKVKIIVYDVRGRVIKTLVDQVKPAGRYTIEFDASGLGSGIYYCDMQCEAQHVTRKMILLK